MNGLRIKRKPAPPVKDDRPINTRSFEEVMKCFNRYMEHVAHDTANESKMYTPEDTKQEMLVVLWRCYTRYGHLPENQFRGVFNRSMQNMLAGCFRRKFVTEDLRHESAEASPTLVRSMQRSDVGEEFYRDGIARLMRDASDETAEIIQQATSSGPKPSVNAASRAIAELRVLE